VQIVFSALVRLPAILTVEDVGIDAGGVHTDGEIA